MNRQCWDIVVVGGGVIGCAIAYEVARGGQSCLLIEQNDIAGGASGANMGLVELQDVQLGPMVPHTLAGFARVAELEAELDADLEYRPHGSLLLLRNDEDVTRMAPRREALNRVGIPMTLVSPDRIRDIEPSVRSEGLAGAVYVEEAQLNPLSLVLAYADRARAAGAVLQPGCTALEFRADGDAVGSIRTSAGDVACGAVVLATGAWTGSLLATLRISLPFHILKGQAAITEPVPPLLRNFVGLAFSRRVELEQCVARGDRVASNGPEDELSMVTPAATQTENGGLIIGQASQCALDADSDVMEWGLPAMADEILEYLPALERVSVLRTWAAPVPFTLDHEPVIGPVGGLRNLIVAAGFKSALVVTPIMANKIARWVATGHRPEELAPFAADRFSAALKNDDR